MLISTGLYPNLALKNANKLHYITTLTHCGRWNDHGRRNKERKEKWIIFCGRQEQIVLQYCTARATELQNMRIEVIL